MGQKSHTWAPLNVLKFIKCTSIIKHWIYTDKLRQRPKRSLKMVQLKFAKIFAKYVLINFSENFINDNFLFLMISWHTAVH